MDENQQTAKETEYLREAMRLAELRLAEQQKTSDIIRRQTGALITYGTAAITYLYAGDTAMPLKQHWLLYVVAFGNVAVALVFAKAAYHCIKIFDVKEWGVPGADANYLLHEYFGGDFNKMAGNLLEEYQKIFDRNGRHNEDKAGQFVTVKIWGIAGIAGAAVLIVVEKVAPLVL